MPAADRTRILIPTYNEAGNIEAILTRIFAVERTLSVLVVDDNSPDGTAAIVEQLQQRWPTLALLRRVRDRGFANSYRDGMRRTLADPRWSVLVTMDADFSHEPEELPAMLALLDHGADLVIGSRHTRGGRFPGIPLWRRILSKSANTYVRVVLGLPIADCTAGYLALRTDILRDVPPEDIRSEGYGFLFELKYRSFRAGYRLREHPVAWPNRHQGKSKMSRKIMWEAFRLPWRLRRQARQSETSGAARETGRPRASTHLPALETRAKSARGAPESSLAAPAAPPPPTRLGIRVPTVRFPHFSGFRSAA